MSETKITSSNVAAATFVLSEILRSPLASRYSVLGEDQTTKAIIDLHQKLAEHFATLPSFDIRHLNRYLDAKISQK